MDLKQARTTLLIKYQYHQWQSIPLNNCTIILIIDKNIIQTKFSNEEKISYSDLSCEESPLNGIDGIKDQEPDENQRPNSQNNSKIR